jgi:adenylate cyclase
LRVGIRTALSAIVLGCVLVSAGTVHLSWRHTASTNSLSLAAGMSRQITAAVRTEVSALIAKAEAAFGAIRTIFAQNVIDSREANKREFVFLAQIQAQPALSWIAFGWSQGAFFGSYKLGDGGLEIVEVALDGGSCRRRTDRYIQGLSDGYRVRRGPSRRRTTTSASRPGSTLMGAHKAPARWVWITKHTPPLE